MELPLTNCGKTVLDGMGKYVDKGEVEKLLGLGITGLGLTKGTPAPPIVGAADCMG